MGKEALERRVLSNPDISIYQCGRQDIQAGIVDRRVLATLEFLASSGLKPTVGTLRCGHSYLTTSGNVSEHSSGNAVDIVAINGTPIVGHQGEGSITDITVRQLLTLQGSMKPHQIITLMQYAGTDNTFAMADHYDHIHVGFHPLYGTNDQAGKRHRRRPRAGSVEPPDRAPELDREPRRAAEAEPLRGEGQAEGPLAQGLSSRSGAFRSVSGRLDDVDVARRVLDHALRDAREDPPVGSLVADHQDIHRVMLRQADEDVRRVAVAGERLGLHATLARVLARCVEEPVDHLRRIRDPLLLVEPALGHDVVAPAVGAEHEQARTGRGREIDGGVNGLPGGCGAIGADGDRREHRASIGARHA